MRVLLVLAAILIPNSKCGSIEQAKEMIKEEIEVYVKCAEEENVPLIIMEDISKNYELLPTREVKCMCKCHLVELNIKNSEPEDFSRTDRRLRETGSIISVARQAPAVNQNEEAVLAMLEEYPTTSTRRIGTSLGTSHMTVDRVLMSGNGSISWERIEEINELEFYKPEDAKIAAEGMAICKERIPQIIGGDLCETAFIATKCYLDELKKLHLPLPSPDLLDDLEE